MTREERMRLVAEWAHSLGDDSPHPADLWIVAALGLQESAPAAEFLWKDPASLRRHWSTLHRLLRAPDADYEPAVPPAAPHNPAPHPAGAAAYPVGLVAAADELPYPAAAHYPTQTAHHPDVDVEVTAPYPTTYQPTATPAMPPPPQPSAPSAYPPVYPSPRTGDLPRADAYPVSLPTQPSAPNAYPPVYPSPLTGDVPRADVYPVSLPDALHDPYPGSLPGAYPASDAARYPSPGEPQERFAGDVNELPVVPAVVGGMEEAVEVEWIEPMGRFAPFSWEGYTGDQPASLAGILVDPQTDGVRLSWPAVSQDGCVLYRVVQSLEQWPFVQPEVGTIGATRKTEVVAPLRAGASAVTYLTVWANCGENEFEARDAQPVLVAKGEVVWPLRSLKVSATPVGEIVGRFDVRPGATVEVQRFVESEMPTSRVFYDQARALTAGVEEGGFADRDAPKGEWLLYAAYVAAVTPEGVRYSEPVVERVRYLPEPQAVKLNVEAGSAGLGTFDITWTAPAFGTVEVYLSPELPEPGLGDATRTSEVLEMYGVLAHGLPYPVTTDGGRRVISGVSMDPTWVKGYFYGVHKVAEDTVRLGPVESRVNAQPPLYPLLVERVDTQVVTFQWPAGVRLVEVYQGPASQQQLDPNASEVIATLTEDEYQQRGGLRFERPLPSNGCALYLFSVVYDQGRKEFSRPTRLEYAGISRLRYMIEPGRRDGTPITANARADFYRVMVKSDDQMPATSLCLVARPQRLPLHPRDQEGVVGNETRPMPFLAFEGVSPVPGQVVPLGEFPAGDRPAYVRLFVSSADMAECARVAIIDPEIRVLQVLV